MHTSKLLGRELKNVLVSLSYKGIVSPCTGTEMSPKHFIIIRGKKHEGFFIHWKLSDSWFSYAIATLITTAWEVAVFDPTAGVVAHLAGILKSVTYTKCILQSFFNV